VRLRLRQFNCQQEATMQRFVGAAIALWLAPVFAVGVYVFWRSPAGAIVIGLALGLLVARLTARAMTETIAPALRERAVAVVVSLLAAAAVGQMAMISVYVAEPSHVEWSYMASDPWRVRHSCMTAYVEAIRFCGEPGTNIYQMDLYEPRMFGPLKVDSFHYPPPFLILPGAVHAIRSDVFGFRGLWFVMQCTVLATVVFGLAHWIRGRAGAYAAAGAVVAFATPQFVYSLQQGNVQSTAVPLAALALVLLWRHRYAAGAPLLAYVAAAKIFPGILVVYLAAARRWKALVATAVCGAAVLALTLALFGARPFEDFIRYELPRISSGDAFPQAELNAVGNNLSVYGITVRLRQLGVETLTRPRGLAIASMYGLAVIALAAFAGWRSRLDLDTATGRLRLVQVAVALLLLSSLRSPFVGFYGFLGAVWLFTLLAAEQPSANAAIASWGAIGAFAIAHTWIPSPAGTPTTVSFVLADVLVCGTIALCLFSVVRSWREAIVPVRRAVLSGAS
jgi:alpha-1,2-mannosyltransferase